MHNEPTWAATSEAPPELTASTTAYTTFAAITPGQLRVVKSWKNRNCGPRTFNAKRVDMIIEGAGNPLPWMSEIMDLRKEKNFFESRVIKYQTGGAPCWD